MAERQIDPARLSGEALRRWYTRTADEIEQERAARFDRRQQEFFGSEASPPAKADLPDNRQQRLPTNVDDVLWVADGRGGFRAAHKRSSDFEETLEPHQQVARPQFLPTNAAASEDGELVEIGSRENRALKKLWIQEYGPWPRTKDGRDYEVSHKRAIADGGKNSLSNIEPIHPDDHRPMHVRERDSSRWGKRGSIASAFGGKVEPSRGGPVTRGLGLIGSLSNLTGILSGRVRTDSFSHFTTDMLGLPSVEDYQRDWDWNWGTTYDANGNKQISI